jgi:HEPN/RES N-terminal domain 1/RES domain
MGREKDRLIEEEERGWRSVTRKLVCDSCVRDGYLSAHIAENGKPAACGYCGIAPEDANVSCIPFDDLMDLIGDGINWAYASADNEGIPYESAEGGYAFPDHMFSTYELVVDQVGLEVENGVLEDILRALPDQTWCRRRFGSLSLNDALHMGWEEFVEKVQYETRYLFTLPEPSPGGTDPPPSAAVVEHPEEVNGESIGLHEPNPLPEGPEFASGDPDFGIDYDLQEGIPVYEMLDAIGRLVRRLELIKKFDSGITIFRVRVVDKECTLAGPHDLGPPAREDATQPNRMSPSGIVMFYGAMDRDTALVETFQPDREGAENKRAWVASFEVLRELRLLDLTRLPTVPSIFNAGRRDLQDGISFLHQFVDDLVQPIKRDGRELIDYVPTQIVTEYVRHRFRTVNGKSVHGILYRSSKRPSGTACVLFIDGANCGAEVEGWQRPEQVLRLLEDRTEILDGAAAATWWPKA